MKASVRWLNRLLEPADLTSEAVEQLLTDAGFPIDTREPLPDGDVRLEVEVTSNRGDCLSHIGQAREIAARSGRRVNIPQPPRARLGGEATDAMTLRNEVPAACPRFTAHVITGVTVGPSPAWLVEALEAVGQRSINNVVDVTNYINFLYGQPTHAFDLSRLAGRSLIVRFAKEGEALTTLDGKARKLRADEVVVADAERAQSLAGVMGGADSEVSASTRDIMLEAATWDPVAVRRAARRHQLRTDASHRFERVVDPRTIDEPAELGAALIAELAGGTLCNGMLDAGRPAEPLRAVSLRTQRCRDLLGVVIDDATIERILAGLSIAIEERSSGLIRCRIPAYRLDLEREVDLIEEVARVHGLDRVPIHDKVSVRVRPPQHSEAAIRAMGEALSGLGFFETVTFSFISPKHAKPFLGQGLELVAVDDDRRKADGTLRPSTIPSLMLCRKANQDAGATSPGGVRLFESAATFAQRAGNQSAERRTLALLMDVPGVERGKAASIEQRQLAVRLLRGAVETIVAAVWGSGIEAAFKAAPPAVPALDASASAAVVLNGREIGHLGLIEPGTQRLFDLDVPVAIAELDLAALLPERVPVARVHELPAFPSIERDLSLIVDEAVTWESVRSLVSASRVERLEGVSFIGTYRGKQIGTGKKSVTLRLRFRDPARTLRHEEVDPQVAAIVKLAGERLIATLRA